MTKLVVILGFLVSFAAGVVIGSSRLLVGEAPANTTAAGAPSGATTQKSSSAEHGGGDARRSRSSYLTAELGLTVEQRTQLDGIWSAMAKANDQDDRRRGYRRERDEAIAQLVPPGRLGDYDQIIDTYHDRVEALDQASRDAYAGAVEQTKQILTPEQRTRYEELLKRHKWGPGVRDPRHAGRGSETRATSQQPGGADGDDPHASRPSSPFPSTSPSMSMSPSSSSSPTTTTPSHTLKGAP